MKGKKEGSQEVQWGKELDEKRNGDTGKKQKMKQS